MHHIRPATSSDLPSINHIYGAWLKFASWDRVLSESAADFESVSSGERVLVCCGSDDRAVGVISIWEPDSFIHHLYVDPQHQRSGIGTALIDSLAGWLPKPWTLKCDKRNKTALEFYGVSGWQRRDVAANADDSYWLLERV